MMRTSMDAKRKRMAIERRRRLRGAHTAACAERIRRPARSAYGGRRSDKGVDQSLVNQLESIIIGFLRHRNQSMAADEKNG